MIRDRHLVIMARLPEAGRVKTRLAAEIGVVEAVRTYRVLLDDAVRRLAGDRRWMTWLAVAPGHAADRLSPSILRGRSGVAIVRQGRGGLGERMQRLMDRLPQGPVVIVGSDVPEITRADVAAAFRALGAHQAVFGPAVDGGYWLVGQSRMPRTLRLFDGVRWSSQHALADTLANVDGRSVALLRALADLDDGADYRRWRSGRLGSIVRQRPRQ